jgi:hypothetical protein
MQPISSFLPTLWKEDDGKKDEKFNVKEKWSVHCRG